MSVWPESLPVPLRTISIIPGRRSESNDQASGRRIVRNWGDIPADTITVQLRIGISNEPIFNYFWNRTGLDGIWFTATWLTTIGYADHKARFIGYPKRKGVTNNIIDYSFNLLVQESALCIDNDEWPSAGTGGS